eukprot:11190494-Lingulodinium_polyedra.AAC.1
MAGPATAAAPLGARAGWPVGSFRAGTEPTFWHRPARGAERSALHPCQGRGPWRPGTLPWWSRHFRTWHGPP